MTSADSRPRVGYVLKMYPRLSETFILNEILAHEEAGLDIDIFSLRAPVDGRFHGDLGRVRAAVTWLPGHPIRSEDLWTAMRTGRDLLPGFDALWSGADGCTAREVLPALHIALAARARGITHLHAHFATVATSVARLAAALAGIPYSFTAHAKDIFHDDVDMDHVGTLVADAKAVVTVSDFNVEYLRQRYPEHGASVRRIYNGLDLGQFAYEPPAARPPLIVGVGRLVEKKGFADLIDACAILARRGREFRCEIIGDGELREILAARIDSTGMGRHVKMLGPRTRHEVMERVQAAAAMAAPCVVAADGNRDGLPTVLLETMALGTPCVSTDVVGIPEIVRDGETGLLVAPNDPAALAEALQRLLDDHDLRMRLAARARALVEADFDIHRNVAAIREIFAPARVPARPLAVETS